MLVQNCSVINDTVMICPSPAINNLNVSLGRRRRDVGTASTEYSLNAYYWSFYLGFIMDGYKKYENLNASLPDQSVLYTFVNPIINEFTEPDRLKWFYPSENFIFILVNYIFYFQVVDLLSAALVHIIAAIEVLRKSFFLNNIVILFYF